MVIPKFHVVIPARYNSSRLPGKPIVNIAGTPMVVRVFQCAKAAFSNVEIIVATDDLRIGAVLDTFNVPWEMTCVNHESGADRIAEVCDNRGWEQDDVVINIQGDEPLVPVELLQKFLAFCQNNLDLEMATISAPIEDLDDVFDPHVVKVVSNMNGCANYFSRNPIPYIRDQSDRELWSVGSFRKHIGIYAYKVDVLKAIAASGISPAEELERLEQLRALWLGVRVAVMNWTESPPHGVDTPEDVERVTRLIKEVI